MADNNRVQITVAVIGLVGVIAAAWIMKPPHELPTIDSFTPSKSEIKSGETVIISWKVRDAKEVEVEPFASHATQGSYPDKPKESRKYTLMAKNSMGSVTSDIQVLVTAPNAGGPNNPIAVQTLVAHPAPRTDTFTIDEPNVKQAMTEYPNVKFSKGDTVEIDAGGCVQTGGAGKTWKRYVNPQSNEPEERYYGVIFIPGAMTSPDKIQNVLGKKLKVALRPDPGHAVLQLGYKDDNYIDNGYWGHDDGTNDQCKNVGNAYVHVTVQHR